jgi:peptidoglycan/LPS O-acetylase OafA/YrhL
MVQRTWHGIVQNASRGVSTLLLIATSGVIAAWLAAEGRRAWAWLCAVSVPVVFAALAAVGLALGTNPGAVAFLATPWVWVTALAVHFYRREAGRGRDLEIGRRGWTGAAARQPGR